MAHSDGSRHRSRYSRHGGGERPWVPPRERGVAFFSWAPFFRFVREEEEGMLRRRRREIKQAEDSFIKCAASRELFFEH